MAGRGPGHLQFAARCAGQARAWRRFRYRSTGFRRGDDGEFV